MSKPWEMELRTRAANGETACAVYDTTGRMVADLRMRFAPNTESEIATLFSAAPDMARALLGLFGDAAHTSFCPALVRDSRRCHPECAAARAALTKAGVPLP